jgi:tellurite resistance protein
VDLEKQVNKVIVDTLNLYRDTRDRHQETLFRSIYGREILHQAFVEGRREICAAGEGLPASCVPEEIEKAFESGGQAEGLIRVMMAVTMADRIFDRAEYAYAEKVALSHPIFSEIRPAVFKDMVKQQAMVLQADEKRALKALGRLIKKPEDRREALALGRQIADADGHFSKTEKAVLEKIRRVSGHWKSGGVMRDCPSHSMRKSTGRWNGTCAVRRESGDRRNGRPETDAPIVSASGNDRVRGDLKCGEGRFWER